MIIRFLVTVLIAYLLYKLGKAIFGLSSRSSRRFPHRAEEIKKVEDLVEDPYCHVNVPVSEAFKGEVDGKVLYFCSRTCWEKYRELKRGRP